MEPGIECLRQERQVRRGQVFQELVAYWQELRGQGFWVELARRMDAVGGAGVSPVLPEDIGNVPVPPEPEDNGKTPAPPEPEDTGTMPVPPGDVAFPEVESPKSPASANDRPARMVRRKPSPVALSKSNGR